MGLRTTFVSRVVLWHCREKARRKTSTRVRVRHAKCQTELNHAHKLVTHYSLFTRQYTTEKKHTCKNYSVLKIFNSYTHFGRTMTTTSIRQVQERKDNLLRLSSKPLIRTRKNPIQRTTNTMTQLHSMLRIMVVFAQFLAFASSFQQHESSSSSRPLIDSSIITPTATDSTIQSRRSFFSSAAVAAATITSCPQKAEARKLKFPWEKEIYYTPYQDFKDMLLADQIAQVEFGIDGKSLLCSDLNGVSYLLNDIPDDPPLLKELYRKGIVVTLQEMKFEKKMNTVSWFRDLVGAGDDITDEERYEYRGYKTYRQNIPERSYVPSNLITGYDLSRNMKK